MRRRICRTECIKVVRRISLRINNFLISPSFHRKITALPFTPIRYCGTQAGVGAIDQTILILRHAGARHSGAAVPFDLLGGREKGTFTGATRCASP
jgi:hypothetical protein